MSPKPGEYSDDGSLLEGIELRKRPANPTERPEGMTDAERIAELESKVEQMEEALREIAEAEVDWAQGVDENFTRLQVIAERALSPSDTEEKA